MTHTTRCPVRHCDTLILAEATMCSEDWRRLPRATRDEITDARFRGQEPFLAALAEAVAYLGTLTPLPTVMTYEAAGG